MLTDYHSFTTSQLSISLTHFFFCRHLSLIPPDLHGVLHLPLIPLPLTSLLPLLIPLLDHPLQGEVI